MTTEAAGRRGVSRPDPRADQPPSPHHARFKVRPWYWQITRLCWWRHPGYIGVRRRDFYAWRRA